MLTLVISSLAAPNTKPSKPAMGVKTPGVQIPFANLKPEAEFRTPAKPEWLFFSAPSTFAQGKDSLDRIDPKTNKQIEPIAGLSNRAAEWRRRSTVYGFPFAVRLHSLA